MPFLNKFRALFQRQKLEAEMTEEMRHHVELQTDMNLKAGMNAGDARYAALRQFGNVASVQESARDIRAWRWLPDLAQDLRQGLRQLLRQRSFTLVALVIFALGIGVNTTIFSALNGIVLRPLAVTDPERVMRVWGTNAERRIRSFSVSFPDYKDWVQASRSWAVLAATDARSLSFLTGGEPVQIQAQIGTAQIMPLFDLRPVLGRGLQPGDDEAGRGRVAVLGENFWRRRFAASPDVLDRPVTIDGQAYTIVGVVADTAIFPGTEAFLPLPPFASPDRDDRDFEVYGRLRGGVTVAQAEAEMVAVAANVAAAHPDDNRGWSVRLEPLFDVVVGPGIRRGLGLVLAAGGLLLAIACANLAGLLLVRVGNRTRELAVRAALGGGRGRLIRQLTTEACLLAVLGGAAGGLLAWWGTGFLRSLDVAGLPRTAEIALDWRVLGFAAGITLLTGVLAGVMPAISASRVSILSGLKASAMSGAHRSRLRSSLIVGQLAFSIVLLAVAALLLQTFRHLQRTDLGFRAEQVLTARLTPPRNGKAVIETLVERVKQLPGVVVVGAISSAPMSNYNTSNNVFPVGPAAIAVTESIQSEWRIVTADYFSAMQIPVLRGRAFTAHDGQGSRVVVISESLARALWGDEDPIGKQVNPGGGTRYSTVVGVVGDVRSRAPGAPPKPAYYLSAHSAVWGSMTLTVRVAGDAAALVPMIRNEMKAVDPTLPLFDVQTMEESIGRRLAPQRATALVLGAFATLALVLAATGIYGVMAQSTLQRTREIGIRLALGAQKRDVLRPLLLEGGRLIGIGVGLGAACALAATQLLREQLVGVSPADPLTLTASMLLLGAVALLACWLPARRAAKVNPMIALRAE
jgi:predicted permease